jgi:hypothetical protein
MSAVKFLEETPKVSARAPMPRTWAGKQVKAEERATHYLHLSAVPCEKCKGPVLSGWVGRRADDITRESEVSKIAGICLSCGVRPEGQAGAEPTPVRIRPFEWEWIAEALLPAKEADGDALTSELAQDADTDINSSMPHKEVLR